MVIGPLIYHAGAEAGGDDDAQQDELYVFETTVRLYC
jgi:hypothetical protein